MTANDNDNDDDDDSDERMEQIAGAVKDFLREGEAFLVRCEDDDILVEEAPHVRLEQEHPRLYGRLLSLNDQLESGCGVTLFLLAAGGLLCLGLHVGWLDDLLTANVANALRSWWFSVPFFVVLFFSGGILADWWMKRTYRRGRADLFAVMDEEGFDRDTLVPLLKDDLAFANIAKQLKLDPGPFRTEP